MNVFRYCILLLVTIISLVSIVSAPAPTNDNDNSVIPAIYHTHTFTGVNDETQSDMIVYGGWVKDTVATISGGAVMRFEWFDPSGDRRRMSVVTVPKQRPIDVFIYEDILPDTYHEDSSADNANWLVTATESRTKGKNWRSDGTFTVAKLPEYSFGSFISLFFAGILYFVMRRVMGPVNVN